MKVIKALVVAGAAVFAASAVNAATIGTFTSSGSCKTIDVTPEAAECFGTVLPEPTNDSNTDLNQSTFDGETGLFGETDWVFAGKFNTGNPEDPDFGLDPASLEGIELELDPDNGSAPGEWSVADNFLSEMFGEIVVVLKQSNTWSAYLYDDSTGIPNGGVFTAGAFDTNGLSHLSIYGRGEGSTEIPLPAAGWLLLGGLGGLYAMRRRKA